MTPKAREVSRGETMKAIRCQDSIQKLLRWFRNKSDQMIFPFSVCWDCSIILRDYIGCMDLLQKDTMKTVGRQTGFLDQESIFENGKVKWRLMFKSQNQCILAIFDVQGEGEERI